MRSEIEVIKQLSLLKQNRVTEGPYSELKNIAWHAAKQALEWILEEKESPLTY